MITTTIAKAIGGQGNTSLRARLAGPAYGSRRSLLPNTGGGAIWGDQDRIIPVEYGYAVYAARPGIRLEVLAGVGHFPQVECPTKVVDLIEDFISTTDHRSILCSERGRLTQLAMSRATSS